MNDEILDWIINKIERFSKAGKGLTGFMKKSNDLRLRYYSEFAETRIEELKKERDK